VILDAHIPIIEGIKSKSPDGIHLIKSGQISELNINGIGRKIYQNQIHEGQFLNGFMNGYGRIILQNGGCYMGYLKKQKTHGYGKNIFESGDKYFGYYKDG
jgi:hypothetical protein